MELYRLTIKEAGKGLKKKNFSSHEIVGAILKRIKQIDKKIKAYLLLDEENALLQAKKADELRAKGVSKSDLLGIPFCLKDNICTEGLRTSAAAKILENYAPVYDSTVSQRLKRAGAVFLGKTNLDAWGHG